MHSQSWRVHACCPSRTYQRDMVHEGSQCLIMKSLRCSAPPPETEIGLHSRCCTWCMMKLRDQQGCPADLRLFGCLRPTPVPAQPGLCPLPHVLKGHVKHWDQEDADRTRGQHPTEHRRSHGAATQLGSPRRKDEWNQ